MNDYIEYINTVRTLVADKQPQIDISGLLYRHKCFYLLSKCKTHNQIIDKFKAELGLNVISIRERYKKCRKIFTSFTNSNIPYALIKGAILSMVIYGSPYGRYFGDIDILIDRNDIDKVKEIMQENGFVQGRITNCGIVPYTRKELLFHSAMSHQVSPFVKYIGNDFSPYLCIDVNLDILWGENKTMTDMKFVLDHIMPFKIYDIPIKKLEPEMEFIALCLHHYKDMNSIYLLLEGRLRLNLFCDIYYYIKNGNLNMERLYMISQQLNVNQYVYYCLYYCDMIFDDPQIKDIYNKFYSFEASELLNRFGLADWEMQEWKLSFFERLFMENLEHNLKETLSPALLKKVEINKEYM